MGGKSEYSMPLERILFPSIPGCSIIKLRGRNATISSTAQTIWGPASTYAQLTAAVALEAVSSSTNDAAAGTGARTVEVDLVDGNYVQTTVTVTLNGTTAVAIPGTYLACNGARVLTSGSGLVNAGTVSVRTVSGSVVKRRITTGATLGLGVDADFLYTVPDGHTAIIKPISFSGTGVTGDLTCYLNTLDSSGQTKNQGAGKSSLYVTAFNGAVGSIDFGTGLRVPGKTLIELRAITSAGAGDLVAMGELILIKSGINNGMGF